jgi:orotate phosphoribosyltransferase
LTATSWTGPPGTPPGELWNGGPDVVGRRITLVEDVITSGAVRAAVSALRELGAVVDTVVCAIDRSSEGTNPLDDVALEVHSVLTKADLDEARATAAP